MKKINKLLNILVIITVISLILSSYLIYLHYSETSSFCDFSPSLSCDIVNKSRYSEFPPGNGIPVSILGFLTFAVILVLLLLIKKDFKFKVNKKRIDKKLLINFIIYILIFSLMFAAYLVYTELFLILSICILCVALDILIMLMLFLACKLKGVVK